MSFVSEMQADIVVGTRELGRVLHRVEALIDQLSNCPAEVADLVDPYLKAARAYVKVWRDVHDAGSHLMPGGMPNPTPGPSPVPSPSPPPSPRDPFAGEDDLSVLTAWWSHIAEGVADPLGGEVISNNVDAWHSENWSDERHPTLRDDYKDAVNNQPNQFGRLAAYAGIMNASLVNLQEFIDSYWAMRDQHTKDTVAAAIAFLVVLGALASVAATPPPIDTLAGLGLVGAVATFLVNEGNATADAYALSTMRAPAPPSIQGGTWHGPRQ